MRQTNVVLLLDLTGKIGYDTGRFIIKSYRIYNDTMISYDIRQERGVQNAGKHIGSFISAGQGGH